MNRKSKGQAFARPLAAAERHQLLIEWNDSARSYPAGCTLAELFHEQAAVRPEAMAVAFGDEWLSYGELARRARAVASCLSTHRLRPEEPVAVCLERSAEAIVATLGILEAGGVYVPLDRESPAERLALLLQEVGARILFGDASLGAPAGVTLLTCRQAEAEGGAQLVDAPAWNRGAPQALACILFTSGSTGRPKGVAIHQGGLVRLARENDYYRFAPSDRVAHLANLAFDAAAFEIWGALLHGGCLVGIRRDQALDPAALRVLVAKRRLNVILFTTSLFHQVAQHEPAALAELDHLFFGGETVDPRAVAQVFAQPGRCRVVNLYGPTENSSVSTWYPVPRVDASALAQGALAVSIGRPMANSTGHVVGADGELVPTGVEGELLVGGVGLARGYLGRPALTAERFVPDPFSGRPGQRLYRTGDMVRHQPDGALGFLGRRDHQVKLRGVRIELGEVEAALLQDPEVATAAVLMTGTSSNDRRLVAFVAPLDGSPRSGWGDQLRARLSRRLPPAMVPAAFVVLAEMPLNANGKIDRRALAERAVAAAESAPRTACEAPVGPVEAAVAAIWSDLLKVEGIGRHDDFRALGGHSLLAAQVRARLKARLGVELPLSTLFQASSLAALAAAVAAERRLGDGPEVPSISRTPRPADGAMPLSFQQQRLWFLDRYLAGSAAYNVTLAVELASAEADPALQPATLAFALSAVVRRHEVLGMAVLERDGVGVQVPSIEPPAGLPTVDLSRLELGGEPRGVGEGALAALCRRLAATPIGLSSPPLFRFALLRLGRQCHTLLLSFHHAIFDGWSLSVLLGELAQLYRSRREGRSAELPPLPLEYADYAAWQRSPLHEAQVERDLDFWRRELQGAAALELPTDRPRPLTATTAAHRLVARLPAELTSRLSALARKSGASLFSTLLAGLAALLGRLAGGRDVLVGYPSANRERLELEGLIGFFVNTLALRARLDGDPGFGSLAATVAERILAASAHQEVPLDRLVQELAPDRGSSLNPLLSVLFVLQNIPQPPAELAPGIALGWRELDAGEAIADLVVGSEERDGEIELSCQFRRDLWDETTVRRWLEAYTRLLAAVSLEPERPLSTLPWLGDSERQQLFVEWNDSATPYPADRSVAEVFLERVASAPDAMALAFGDERLSYGALARRAGALAAGLAARGLEPEEPVAICLDRSIELIVATLGILAAGGAYVPLDRESPVERLALALDDVKARFVFAPPDFELQSGLELHSGVERLASDQDEGEGEDRAFAWRSRPPEGLACVIFTSGSTGRPKGVALPDRGLVRLVCESDYVRFAPGDRVAHASNVAFDAANLEIWGALLGGGCLLGIGREQALDPARLATTLAERRPTFLFLTTSLFNLVAESSPSAFAGLDHMLFGGETADPGAVGQVLAARPPRRLVNIYGPTECSTLAIWYLASTVSADANAFTVPIGRPMSNTDCFVVDAWGEAATLGAIGEMLLGGPGLARAYVGRPAATAERFVPDSISGRPGQRLYRTGDLVRRRGNGVLEFVGRRDHQVKLRGFRIELGEVEAALLADPEVSQAVVMVEGMGSSDSRLVAYLVPVLGAAENRGDWSQRLRLRLGQRLPSYMVPAVFAVLSELPLNANGKIDRQRIREMAPRSAAPRIVEPPRTPTERAVAAVWAEVLRLGEVGRDDDFFALGGHSLLAVRVQSRLRDRLGVEVPLSALFAVRTPAALAQWVEAAHSEARPSGAIARRDPAGPTPASFAQARLWFLDRLDPGAALYNVPVTLELAGPLRVAVLWQALAEIGRRHETLRTVFAAIDGEPTVVVGPAQTRWPVLDLGALGAAGSSERAESLGQLEARRPFDLAKGPVLRLHLLRLTPWAHRLLLNVHHIAADAWSFDLLWGELEALYASALLGAASPLTEPPVQYGDYSLWQRRSLAGDELERKMAFWRQRLSPMPPPLELPTDRPRAAMRSLEGETLHRRLSPALGPGLATLGRAHGASAFIIAFAAFATVLGRWAGQSRFALGAPVANRGAVEVEGLIGFFVNSVVLVADLEGDPSFAALLERTRDHVLTAFGHQDLPFEKLVEELEVERDLSRSPIFDALLSLDQGTGRSIELAGNLTMTPRMVPQGTAKWDLSLYLHEPPPGASQGGFEADLEFASQLFDAATAERLFGHFETLLLAALERPETSIWHLPMLSAAERSELEAWGDGGAPSTAGAATLYELVLAQAERSPEAVAVVAAEEQLSYRELVERARRLGAVLAELGVGPERVAAVLLRREAALVVALLAVQAAGGAYLPLDPDYPADRLAFMLEDSAALAVVTRAPLAAAVELGSTPIVTPETGGGKRVALERRVTPANLAPENLAYLIYTSGSTGRPKGVAIEHRSAVEMVRWAATVFSADELSGTLAATSVCFDLSIFEIFLPLARGGTAILADHAVALRSLPHRAAVRLVNTVPSALAALLEAGGLPETVRTVNLAGEPLPGPLAEAIYREPRVEKLYNLYGPSEDTTYSTFDLIESARGVLPSIGRAIAGSEAYVVDGRLERLPRGVPGELCLAGRGLARGYLGRPAKTAESFVPNPFVGNPSAGNPFSPASGADSGRRMYRTGDRVRFRPDGRLDFLGRLDRQIKLRGFRIELGEIEAALGRLAGVKEGAVGMVTLGGEPRLVAWVAPEDAAVADGPWTEALARELGRWLPTYMVPSAWLTLAALPRNPNGKIDRQALPAHDGPTSLGRQPQERESDDFVAPRTPFEELVADLWREVLGAERVGAKDSFFALGGHSLAATKVIARLEDLLGLAIPLRTFFEAPTVERLVAALGELLLAQELSEQPRGAEVPTGPDETPVGAGVNP